ncbi:MAG: phosphoglucosamine mutase [Solirubrobacterales bacterium]
MAGPEARLFGTDGVRGPVGELLDARLALALGQAAAALVDSPRPRVLVVRDTRESGPALESAFAAGAASSGADVFLTGVLPTPAAPILGSLYSFELAAVVSASHNPFTDNGIKLFGADGRKLDDEAERAIERTVVSGPSRAPEDAWGRVERLNTAEADYQRAVIDRYRLELSGRRIALDCANGATFRVAPEVFRRLGAEVVTFNAEPDGRNINRDCGSTHTGPLAEEVRDGGFDIGFAFDGDGDRMLAVDRTGEVRDGDEVLALVALKRSRAGTLGGGVAVTVMTNHGFHRAMEDAGVEVEVTPVGDRHVLEALDRLGWVLGGEQSGHVISTDYAPTGDGLASALALLEALDGEDLAEASPMVRLPQELVNVPVADQTSLEDNDVVRAAIEAVEDELGGEGRVLVRPSGTEPLVRVMVEARTGEEAGRICRQLADTVESELG